MQNIIGIGIFQERWSVKVRAHILKLSSLTVEWSFTAGAGVLRDDWSSVEWGTDSTEGLVISEGATLFSEENLENFGGKVEYYEGKVFWGRLDSFRGNRITSEGVGVFYRVG